MGSSDEEELPGSTSVTAGVAAFMREATVLGYVEAAVVHHPGYDLGCGILQRVQWNDVVDGRSEAVIPGSLSDLLLADMAAPAVAIPDGGDARGVAGLVLDPSGLGAASVLVVPSSLAEAVGALAEPSGTPGLD
jgi:hypothetical protein